MSSVVYGAEYKLQGKWVAKDKELAEFGGERTYIEIDDASAPNISFETAGEEYYPQTSGLGTMTSFTGRLKTRFSRFMF